MDPAARRRTEVVALHASLQKPDGVLPVVIWSHPAAGPTVVVTANVHGDEVVGVAAAHELDERLGASLQCGTVVLYPSLNPRGLLVQSRVHPDDGVDLNRVFPGEARGGAAARTAHAVFQDLTARRPDFVLDLHSDSATSVPYALVDRATSHAPARRAELERRMAAVARASGLFVLLEYPPEEYVRFRLDRSLAGAVVNHLGAPALTLEVGARRSVDPGAVRVVVEAVERVLGFLGATTTPPAAPVREPMWRRMAAPRAQSAGLFEPRIRPGESFAAADVLGTVRGVDGVIREVIRAEIAGRVISWTEQPWLEVRSVPGTVAVLEERGA
jgi:predicted deacylase